MSNEDFDLEKWRKTKSYQKSVREFQRKLYFSARFRNRLKQDILKLEKAALADLERFQHATDIQSRKALALSDTALEVTSKYLAEIAKADDMASARRLTKCKYTLLVHTKRKIHVFECKFFKVGEKRNKKAYLVLEGGLAGRRLPGTLTRGAYSTAGFRPIDEGKYIQKLVDFGEAHYVFRGKKVYRYKTTRRPGGKSNVWVSRM